MIRPDPSRRRLDPVRLGRRLDPSRRRLDPAGRLRRPPRGGRGKVLRSCQCSCLRQLKWRSSRSDTSETRATIQPEGLCGKAAKNAAEASCRRASKPGVSPAHIGYARPVTGPCPGRPRHGHCFLINLSLRLSLLSLFLSGRNPVTVTVMSPCQHDPVRYFVVKRSS